MKEEMGRDGDRGGPPTGPGIQLAPEAMPGASRLRPLQRRRTERIGVSPGDVPHAMRPDSLAPERKTQLENDRNLAHARSAQRSLAERARGLAWHSASAGCTGSSAMAA